MNGYLHFGSDDPLLDLRTATCTNQTSGSSFPLALKPKSPLQFVTTPGKQALTPLAQVPCWKTWGQCVSSLSSVI